MLLLSELLPGSIARIAAINWPLIPEHEGHRLRALGLEAGVKIELLHRGILFWRDPIAIGVDRMTVALRRKVAENISCIPENQ